MTMISMLKNQEIHPKNISYGGDLIGENRTIQPQEFSSYPSLHLVNVACAF